MLTDNVPSSLSDLSLVSIIVKSKRHDDDDVDDNELIPVFVTAV